MKIIGVDFSGAGADTDVGKTWIARGELAGNVLTIESCLPISRAALTATLSNLDEPAVAAMDFPFSVPVEFANCWQGRDVLAGGWEMPNLWAAVSDERMGRRVFDNLADTFVARHGTIKRLGDPPESFSPLNKAYINMVPMTFQGMKMLHRLWGARTVMVPPLPQPSRPGKKNAITLLEVMPGAVLRSLGLPFRRYKGTTAAAIEMRRYILNELPRRTNPLTVDLPVEVCGNCLNNDDAPDSVVAAIAAALWYRVPDRFPQPPANCTRVLLEGWLYTPRGHCPQCGYLPPAAERA